MKQIEPHTRTLYTNEDHAIGSTIRRDGHLWRVIAKRDTGGTERWEYRLERAAK